MFFIGGHPRHFDGCGGASNSLFKQLVMTNNSKRDPFVISTDFSTIKLFICAKVLIKTRMRNNTYFIMLITIEISNQ